jgi:hypothetical protein
MSTGKQSAHAVEQIPDSDDLFRRVPGNRFYADGAIKPGAFSDKGTGMSVSWSRYAQAAACRGNPPTCGVAQLSVGLVRGLGLEVRHAPRDFDRSHADVIGEKDEEMRLALVDIATVAIPAVTK